MYKSVLIRCTERTPKMDKVEEVVTNIDAGKNVCIIDDKTDMETCGAIANCIAKTYREAKVFVYGPSLSLTDHAVKTIAKDDETVKKGHDIIVNGNSLIRPRPASTVMCRGDRPTHILCLRPDSIDDEMWYQFIAPCQMLYKIVYVGRSGPRMKMIMDKKDTVSYPQDDV